MSFAVLLFFTAAVGILLSMGTHVVWQTSRRLMLVIGAIASVSGYAVAIAANAGVPVVWAVLSAMLIGALLGVVLCLSAWRVAREDFLLLALAFSELVRRLAFHLECLTNGAYGLRVAPILPGTSDMWFTGVGILAAAVALCLQLWFRSSRGLEWRIVGCSRSSAELLGSVPARSELASSVVSGAVAALAGIAYVLCIRYIHPDDMGIDLSLAALVVGLAARPRWLTIDLCVMAFILFAGRDFLRLWDIGGTVRFAIHEVVVGAIIILMAIRLARADPGGSEP